jgi:hypothetical protein
LLIPLRHLHHFAMLTATTAKLAIPDCPAAPSFRATVRTQTLHKACEVVGGISLLANHLHVTPVSLSRWMAGEESPPWDVFLACVDIVLSHPRSAKI